MNTTLEAAIAEIRKSWGTKATTSTAGLRVMPDGQPEKAVHVDEVELRKAFQAAGVQPVAQFTTVTYLNLTAAAKSAGLESLWSALWSLPSVGLYAVQVDGTAWRPVGPSGVRQGSDTAASAVDARAIDEAFKLMNKTRKVTN